MFVVNEPLILRNNLGKAAGSWALGRTARQGLHPSPSEGRGAELWPPVLIYRLAGVKGLCGCQEGCKGLVQMQHRASCRSPSSLLLGNKPGHCPRGSPQPAESAATAVPRKPSLLHITSLPLQKAPSSPFKVIFASSTMHGVEQKLMGKEAAGEGTAPAAAPTEGPGHTLLLGPLPCLQSPARAQTPFPSPYLSSTAGPTMPVPPTSDILTTVLSIPCLCLNFPPSPGDTGLCQLSLLCSHHHAGRRCCLVPLQLLRKGQGTWV